MRVIANFVPRIRGVYSAEPEEPPWLLLEVTREGAPTQTIVWPAEQLDQLNFEKLIVGCISRDARGRSTKNLVATYLRMQLSQGNLPRGQYFDQTGWQQIDGQHRYFPDPAPANRLAEPPEGGSPPYLIAEGASIFRLSVDPTLSVATAVEQLIRTFGRHFDIYLPVWGYSLFSVCRSFLRDSGLPTACILYLIATQGFGKTATAKALCQLFDDSNGCITDVYDAGSTISAMERALMTTRDPVRYCWTTFTSVLIRQNSVSVLQVRPHYCDSQRMRPSAPNPRFQECFCQLCRWTGRHG